jgi:hypothetical protein
MTWAKPPTLLQESIAPKNSHWIELNPSSEQVQLPKEISSETLKDPKVLIAYITKNPDKLDVNTMTPMMSMEITQVLLFGGKPLLAIELTHQALKKWPDDLNIIHMWARATSKVGLPSYAKPMLKSSLQKHPDSGYTRYLYALTLFLENPQDMNQLALSHQQLTELLRRNPKYQGPDSVTAQQIQAFVNELQSQMAGNPSQIP